MKLVRQKKDSDCGPACLAMLAGIPLVEATRAIFGDAPRKKYYTEKDQLRAALTHYGVITLRNLRRCSDPTKLTRDALLKTNMRKDGYYHWAVWDAKRQKLLDPLYKRTRPLSCLLVLRRERRV